MSVLVIKAWRDLTTRRVRSTLTLIGIIVGVAGLVAVSTTGRQLADAQASLVSGLGFPDLIVRTAPITPNFPAVIERQFPGATAEGRVVLDWSASLDGPWRDIRVVGYDYTSPPHLSAPELVAGHFPGLGEIAVDSSITALLPVSLGDTLTLRPDVSGRSYSLVISGFTRTPAALDAGILNRGIGYVPVARAEVMLERQGINQVLVRLPSGSDPDVAAAALGRLLDGRGIARGQIVQQEGDLIGSRELDTLLWLLFAFSVLGLALSGFLVANTAASVIQDEANQIGVLKALGGSRGTIIAVYILSAAFLGVLGAGLGFAGGLALGETIVRYLIRLLGYPHPGFSIQLREVSLAVAVGLAIPMLATVIPAFLAARHPTALLLRSYGLAGQARRRATWLTRQIGHLRPLVAIAMRNPGRRPARTAMSIILIAVAVASSIASEGLSRSLTATVDDLYARYGADAWATFSVPADRALARQIARAPEVVVAEPWARADVEINTTTASLWAIPADTLIYDAIVVDGQWLRGDSPRAAVVSANLAQASGIAVGDTVELVLGDETRVFSILGVVDDESTALGSTAAGKVFVTPESLATIRGSRGFPFLAVTFTDHDPVSVERHIAALEERFRPLTPNMYASYSDQAATARTIQVLVLLLRAMVVLVGLTGIIGVINTLAMNVAERRREIGVTRALGGGRREISVMVVGEALVLGLWGYVAGAASGLILAWLLVHFTGDILFRLTFTPPFAFVLGAFALTLGACAIAAVCPAVIASRVRPIEVLRYE